MSGGFGVTTTRWADRWKRPTTVAGFILLGVSLLGWFILPDDRLTATIFGKPVNLIVFGCLTGCLLISPGFLVDQVRAWRSPGPPTGPGPVA